MADERWRRTWEIFHDALDRDGAARAEFVSAACAGDRELIAEVNALLAAHESDDQFLETPASWLAGVDEPGRLGEGARIGPYLIRRIIGSGGMGVVYEAEDEGEIRRRVALKLIRAGMESREILARFAMERRSLALMNHPNIATAYDVGVSADGRPYVAMEYVDGVPITQFCEQHALTLPSRLELFLQVCDAVQHAHQKGILHRDLKPSNVLAGRDGTRTILKVIDFGVAKATLPGGDRPSFVTQAGRFIGTPEYMSPEQAGVGASDVDTRADIYSLGVMLYELLAGVLPVDPERLRSSSFGDIERMLFVDDLPTPSRRAGNATIAKQLRGDLDWIIGRAMEKERGRRYASVSEFASDIRRYLAHEPVLAGPPGAAYRFRKFVQRHRAGVAAATLLVLITVVFVVGLIVSNARTRQALQDAGIERERSNQVSAFLVNLFRVSKPTTAQANATTARELLDKGAADIRSLGDQPVVQAQLMETMGEVYTNLGLLDQAQTLLTDSLEIRRRTLGPDHAQVAQTLARLGRLHMSQGKYQEALARHREALAIYRRAATPDLDAVSTALLNEGAALRSLGETDAAEKSITESIAIRTERLKIEDDGVAEGYLHLGGIALKRGDLDAAERYRRQAVALRLRLHGEGHIDVARARNDLAVVLHQKGDDAGAETVYRDVLSTYVSVLGQDHAEVATIKNNLASVLRAQGKLSEAEPLLRDAVAIRRRQRGDDHPEVAVALNNLALLLRAKGDAAAAVPMLREALAIMRKAYPESHPNVIATLANLGELLHETSAPDAEAVLREALAARQKTLPPSNPNIAVSLSTLGHVRAERGDAKAAEAMLRDALASMQKSWPDDNPRVVQTKAYLGGALAELGQYEEAGRLLKDSQQKLGKSGSPHDRAYIEKQLRKVARFPS
jgi:serine/threonine protein kinase/tetratricopeptide (TPR) repeat protein